MMKRIHPLNQYLLIISLILFMLACSMKGVRIGGGKEDLESTRIAQAVEATVLAKQDTEATAWADLSSTLIAPIPELPTLPVEEQPPQVPLKESAVEPTAFPTLDVNERIKASNVLLFEDVRGYYDLPPYLHQVVANMDFSKGRVIEVGDAVGNFLSQLNSDTKWDIIIVGAEVRTGVRGEFWDVIKKQVDNDVALVAEVWYLDEIRHGRIEPLLEECGIRFQKDWTRESGDDRNNYSIFWLKPESEFFNYPNQVSPLISTVGYWEGDVGDLLQYASGGDAQLLAGKHTDRTSSDAVIASCMEGRVIFQTFSTHDYKASQVKPLWENYIYNTLKNHYLVTEK